jgi:hypothetical protein
MVLLFLLAGGLVWVFKSKRQGLFEQADNLIKMEKKVEAKRRELQEVQQLIAKRTHHHHHMQQEEQEVTIDQNNHDRELRQRKGQVTAVKTKSLNMTNNDAFSASKQSEDDM